MKSKTMINQCQKDRDNSITRSVNHEMYIQKIKKSTLSIFDDKRCHINQTESKSWEWTNNLMSLFNNFIVMMLN